MFKTKITFNNYQRTNFVSNSSQISTRLQADIMEPKYVALILAYISAALTSPISATNNATSAEYVELYRERAKFSKGDLIWYGEPEDGVTSEVAPRATSRSEIWQRSGHCTVNGDPVRCDNENTARNSVCDSLVTDLSGHGSVAIPNPSSRAVCYMGDSEHNVDCCVSWHNLVTQRLTKGDLATPAYRIMSKCSENGISGKINWVWLLDACTSICVSNRPGHC